MTGGAPPSAAANRAGGGSTEAVIPVRVFVLAAVRLYREGIAAVLADDDRFEVVGAAADGPAARPQLRASAPDVVLVEVVPGDAAAHIRAVRVLVPDASVVALGISDDETAVLPLAEAGIVGWVTRDASVEDLRDVVSSAAAGEARCSPRMTASLLRQVALLAEGRSLRHETRALTRRQLEIVALIDEGLSNKEIAHRLSIEIATVKNHVHNILEKLQVSRRSAAAAVVRSPLSR